MRPLQKMFTLEEANALLPRINTLLRELIHKKEVYNSLHDHLFMNELLTCVESGFRPLEEEDLQNSLDTEAKSLEASMAALKAEIHKIRGIGCLIRNLDRGWVEFPAEIAGESVYLNWRRGEAAVCHYRRVTDAADERRLIPRF
ncbi:MAG: hypothetical protein A2Z83_04100 [Omnitrophica bacterium GWA2_52_8]|nr:MAG: hypothetical protein A2Z83_04100 [Omnitrophica bacterium GWA2_52_8]